MTTTANTALLAAVALLAAAQSAVEAASTIGPVLTANQYQTQASAGEKLSRGRMAIAGRTGACEDEL